MRLNQTASKQQASSKTATKNEKRKIDITPTFHLQTMYKRHKCNLIFTFSDIFETLIEHYLYTSPSYSTQNSRSEYNCKAI